MYRQAYTHDTLAHPHDPIPIPSHFGPSSQPPPDQPPTGRSPLERPPAAPLLPLPLLPSLLLLRRRWPIQPCCCACARDRPSEPAAWWWDGLIAQPCVPLFFVGWGAIISISRPSPHTHIMSSAARFRPCLRRRSRESVWLVGDDDLDLARTRPASQPASQPSNSWLHTPTQSNNPTNLSISCRLLAAAAGWCCPVPSVRGCYNSSSKIGELAIIAQKCIQGRLHGWALIDS